MKGSTVTLVKCAIIIHFINPLFRSQIVLCHRNLELQNIHHDETANPNSLYLCNLEWWIADECFLSVGIPFFTMALAFCKVFTVPVYKGKPPGQIRKDHVYYYLPKQPYTLSSCPCFCHQASMDRLSGNLTKAWYERSNFLSNPIRYDKAWIHILEYG